MTIPEISPLFLISICGLSTVCLGVFGVIGFFTLRFTAGELFEVVGGLGGMFGGGDDQQEDAPLPQTTVQRNLRAKAQSYDFDAALQSKAQGTTPSGQFGENTSLRPDRQSRLNANTRNLDLRPPGRQSDNPDALYVPSPPNFNPNSEYLPNPNSNIGGRVGRWNTGRGQSGQRMDSAGNTLNAPDGLGKRPSGKFDEDRRALRNRTRNYDEVFGGKLDDDGDGDPDY